jgi:hypothetical protein
MRCYLLRVFERAAIEQIRSDPRGGTYDNWRPRQAPPGHIGA